MQAETKNCQNCKNDFTIEPEDFAFYEKSKFRRRHGVRSVGFKDGLRLGMSVFSINETATYVGRIW